MISGGDSNISDIELQITDDGSATLYRKDIDEHYHSVKGALAESSHVYIDTGWKKAAETIRKIKVFEVGFGTGLNAALTARKAIESGVPTEYYSVELYPLPNNIIGNVIDMAPKEIAGELRAMHQAEWNRPITINTCFTLIKQQLNFITMQLPTDLSVIYYDAFAPEKQPEMWAEDLFRSLHASMIPGGVLVTYCAKGAIRRMLQSVGFRIERLPGPPGGKREILRATRLP